MGEREELKMAYVCGYMSGNLFGTGLRKRSVMNPCVTERDGRLEKIWDVGFGDSITGLRIWQEKGKWQGRRTRG